MRGKPEKFAGHCTQAALFFNNQMRPENYHVAVALRFELMNVGACRPIRERMISSPANASTELAMPLQAGAALTHV